MGRWWGQRFYDCVSSSNCRRRKWAGAKREASKGFGTVAGKVAGIGCASIAALSGGEEITVEAYRRCNKLFRNTWHATADEAYHDDRLEIRFGRDYVCAPHDRKDLNLSGSVLSRESMREMNRKYHGDAGLNCSAAKPPSQGGCHCATRDAIPIVCGGIKTQIPINKLPRDIQFAATRRSRSGKLNVDLGFVDRVFGDDALMGYLCTQAMSDAPTTSEADEALGGFLGGFEGGFVEDQETDDALSGFLE